MRILDLLTGRPNGVTRAAFDMAHDEADGFAANTLDQVESVSIPPEVFGLSSHVTATGPAPRIPRREAIQVGAVKRARDLIAGTLGTLPLVTTRPDLTIDPASWLAQPEADVAASVTMTRTIEDLLFEGIAWWFVTRYDWAGFPCQVVRLDPRSVDVQAEGRVHVSVDGHRGMVTEWPSDRQLIRFDSPSDPLLVAAARDIRQHLFLSTAAQRAADGGGMVDYFRSAEPGVDPGDTGYITTVLDGWAVARRTRSTGYVPASMVYETAGWDPEKLQLADQREHAVAEIARHAGIDPEDVGLSTTSRTYQNQQDRRKQFTDFTLGAYRAAIEGRLSMGDLTRRGWRVRFDLSDFTRSDDLTRWQAAQAGITVGAITRTEVRAGEHRPPLTPAEQEDAKPAPPPPATLPSAAPTDPQEVPA